MEYFHVQHTFFAMSDKKRKEKLGINQQDRFQTNGRGSWLNLTKVRMTTKGNGSMNMNMQKGGI